MMNIEEFTKSLEAEFEDVKPGTLKPDTNYRQLENWTSMHALIVIAFVDINFGKTINGEDLRGAQTVRDLYELILKK